MNKANKKSSSEKIIKLVLVLLIVLFLAVLGLITFNLFRSKDDAVSVNQEKVRRNVVVISEKTDLSGYNPEIINTSSEHDVKMNSTWVFPDGKSFSKGAYVENPSSNKNDVYFEVYVEGMNQKCFTSPVLPVGSHIENIAFDEVLPEGKYNGTLKYTLLGADGKTSIGTLQVAIKIIIQG